MERYSYKLNEMLVEVFDRIEIMEKQIMANEGTRDLTIGEMHLLGTVAKGGDGGCSISDIAKEQHITMPSATVAINKLVKKGYVQKNKAIHDARQVAVTLTRKGSKINAGHQYFHENMVRNFTKELNEDEKAVLFTSIGKLNDYLEHKIEIVETKKQRLGRRIGRK